MVKVAVVVLIQVAEEVAEQYPDCSTHSHSTTGQAAAGVAEEPLLIRTRAGILVGPFPKIQLILGLDRPLFLRNTAQNQSPFSFA